ncbi:Chemotaxis protein methyltransferase CheR [hydrothermal vent metagenome]|uniref:Chemotaxis protein methyltransferase CheR n=1 Tax=hydrothermal vent metagenome TaxID=652676 RepID=A0A3B0Y854_9ZZZZ
MSLGNIETLLKTRMGLHSSTVGSSTILHAVEQRMRDCEITDISDYERVLLHSGTEMDALIDTVIIPETWFFRDINPFDAFNKWLKEEWMVQHPGDTLRILSVPCSSGEEAYTLAMCLADSDLASSRARIDAIDISSINIDKAHKGEYGKNSFRGNRLEYRDKHFQENNARFRVNDNIREYVNFEQANMLGSNFSSGRPLYHVIFCRNLLIYFDRATQDTAIDRLSSLLNDDGVLFLGHSETGLLLNREFTPLPSQRCFGFRYGKDDSQDEEHLAADRMRRQPPRSQSAAKRNTMPLPFSDIVFAEPGTSTDETGEPDGDLLKQAFRLADEGHLGEAAEQCEGLLSEQTHQADAYFLLGLIRESAGNLTEAEQLLRKAVYLDPAHHEALVHLGIVCEQLGDNANASRFRERAERTASKHLTEAIR